MLVRGAAWKAAVNRITTTLLRKECFQPVHPDRSLWHPQRNLSGVGEKQYSKAG
jgi:hypothetical protein